MAILDSHGQPISSNSSYQIPQGPRSKRNLIMKDWTNQLPNDDGLAEQMNSGRNKAKRERINQNQADYRAKQAEDAGFIAEGERIQSDTKKNNNKNSNPWADIVDKSDKEFEKSQFNINERNFNEKHGIPNRGEETNPWEDLANTPKKQETYKDSDQAKEFQDSQYEQNKETVKNKRSAEAKTSNLDSRKSPFGDLDLNTTTRKKATRLAKSMGFNEDEMGMVGDMFNHNKAYNTSRENLNTARDTHHEASNQYDELKNSMEYDAKSRTASGATQSQRQKTKQEAKLDDLLNNKDAAKAGVDAARSQAKQASSELRGGRSRINEYTKGMGSETTSKFSKLGEELSAGGGGSRLLKGMKGAGKIGAYGAAALIGIGLVQAMSDNKGQQSNSQLYSPGGS